VGQKTRKGNLDVFSRLKDFLQENNMEISDAGIDQCIKNHMVFFFNLHSGGGGV
jgi:hypothetical protein